jgi:hypothetical protein
MPIPGELNGEALPPRNEGRLSYLKPEREAHQSGLGNTAAPAPRPQRIREGFAIEHRNLRGSAEAPALQSLIEIARWR